MSENETTNNEIEEISEEEYNKIYQKNQPNQALILTCTLIAYYKQNHSFLLYQGVSTSHKQMQFQLLVFDLMKEVVRLR